MRIVLRILKIQRGRIILFLKECPSPPFAPLCVVVAIAPAQAVGLAAGGLLAVAPLQVHRGQLPLATWSRVVGPCGLAAGGRPLRPSRSQSCPRAAVALAGGYPLQAPAPAGGRPFATRPCWETSTGRSYIFVFQIRMEKIKEVKRPPL
ncbi:hypothetical protein BHE74_00054483 [Ensete ventricosum]|nr:hypothetical protein BHE74_00054483 [Ensete ventricosum]